MYASKSDYDFRINQKVCRNTLDKYDVLIHKLEREKEKQQQNIKSMRTDWNSESAHAFEEGLITFLEKGDFNKVHKNMKSMKSLLEDILPEINVLLARCEGFVEQLENDEYVEPERPAGDDNIVRNGGILSMNYTETDVVKSICDQICQTTICLRDAMIATMGKCSGIMSGVDHEQSRVCAGANKLLRLSNYKHSLQIYETGIKALENDINIRLKKNISGAFIMNISDSDLKKKDFYRENKKNVSNLIKRSGIEKPGKTFEEINDKKLLNIRMNKKPFSQTNPKDHSDINLKKNEADSKRINDLSNIYLGKAERFSGIKKKTPNINEAYVLSVLEKPVNEWTKIETSRVAIALSKAFEDEDADMINVITEGLVCIGNIEDYITQAEYEYSHINADFKGAVVGDKDKINAILQYVDIEKDLETVAYLSEMTSFGFEVNPVYLNSYAPSMADFMSTSGLNIYMSKEGARLIESCAVFDDGSLSLLMHICPDGEAVQYMETQQMYGIFIKDARLASSAEHDITVMGSETFRDLESYKELMEVISGENTGLNVEKINNFFEVSRTEIVSGIKDVAVDKTADIIMSNADLAEDTILEVGEFVIPTTEVLLLPIQFVISGMLEISEEMAERAEENSEALNRFIRDYIRISNSNIEKSAVFLNMNYTTSYSGEIENATLDQWEDWNNGEFPMSDSAEWCANVDKFLSEDYMQRTFVGVFDGSADGEEKSTEERVEYVNNRLQTTIADKENKDDKTPYDHINEWLSKEGKEISELTYKDYLKMDDITMNAVLDIFEDGRN